MKRIQNLNPCSSYSREFCSVDSDSVPVWLNIVVPDADSRGFEGTQRLHVHDLTSISLFSVAYFRFWETVSLERSFNLCNSWI